MLAHRLAALASIVAALAVPRLVRAECASPAAVFSPAPGAPVPANPTVYLFVPRWDEAEHKTVSARAGGAELPVKVRQLAANDAFITYAVTVETGAARELRVRSSGGAEARYRIDPRWTAPAKRRAQPIAVAHREHHWTCSFTDVWEISIDASAPALRVEWAASAAAFARGAATLAVFPDHPGVFWRRPGRKEQHAPPAIELGHSNCFGYTIPADAVHGELFVRVTPLYADGTAGEPSAVARVFEISPANVPRR